MVPNRKPKTQKPPPGRPIAADIKLTVSIEMVLGLYGVTPPAKGHFTCPCSENHTHGDAHPSANIYKGRIFCHSQKCFGEKGADIFGLVGIKENRPKFADQLKFIIEKFGLSQGTKSPTRRIVKAYDYCDELGRLLFQAVRYTPKGFSQRRPDGSGRWAWNLEGVRLVLYRLSGVLGAHTVLIVEGEKDADLAFSLLPEGMAATSSPLGAGKWKHEYSETLRDKKVILCPDNDEPGRKHIEKIAASIAGIASEVLIVHIPDAHDLFEWATRTKASPADLMQLLETATPYEKITPAPTSNGIQADTTSGARISDEDQNNGRRRESQVNELIGSALENDAEFFHDNLGEAFVSFQYLGGPWTTCKVAGEMYRSHLLHQHYTRTGRAPSSSALNDAQAALTARAIIDGPEHAVHLRVAWDGAGLFLDLCRPDGKIVCIKPSGWKVIPALRNVRFIRGAGALPLPVPIRVEDGEKLDDRLRPFVNPATLDDLMRFTAFIVGTFCPHGAKPIMFVLGEHGSGKTFSCRIAKRTSDPSILEGLTFPQDESDLMVLAANEFVLFFDNQSSLSAEASDRLCRTSSGAAFLTRKKFTNADANIAIFQRPCIGNGITDFPVRPDLLDRSLSVKTKAIDGGSRRGEKELESAFTTAHPQILGELLTVVSCALENSIGQEFHTDERLFDFLKWIDAASPALGWPKGNFMHSFEQGRNESNAVALEANLITEPLLRLIGDVPSGQIETTMGDLWSDVDALTPERLKKSREWPNTPRGLRAALSRLVPNLRREGIVVTFLEKTRGGRIVKIVRANPAPQAD